MLNPVSAIRAFGLGQIRCSACGSPFFAGFGLGDIFRPGLCGHCRELLSPYAGPRCRLCGVPWSLAELEPDFRSVKRQADICRKCEVEPPPWQGFAYHGIYDGSLREAILRLKFGEELGLAAIFGRMLLEASQCLPAPDALVAIPQHPAHLRSRGFNQAHELAREVARLGGFHVDASLLKRVRSGPAQEGLTAAERVKNLEGAFAARASAGYRRIWLVDDVLTTGSTCASAARALLGAGTAEVYALFVARTAL